MKNRPTLSSTNTSGAFFRPILKINLRSHKNKRYKKSLSCVGFRDDVHYSSARTSSDYLRKIVRSIREIEAEIN